jgi:ubiquinone/menaquinone biosynthesis C-methylase UbiE
MNAQINAFSFSMMANAFKLRDLFIKPQTVLSEAHLRAGYSVVDFGCGPGSFSLEAARQVGPSGKVYAIDKNPLALNSVRKRVAASGLENVRTILTDGVLDIPSHSMDVVLLYDIFHYFVQPHPVLHEVHRVLKPHGILSMSDHHMKERDIFLGILQHGLFSFFSRGKYTYTFISI